MSHKRWKVDSCPCVLIYEDSNFTFVRREVRCREHSGLDGQPLFDGVLAHCASFNRQYSLPPSPTDDDRKTESARIKTLKEAEKARITRLGPPDINPTTSTS
jgi:hypothetical protein